MKSYKVYYAIKPNIFGSILVPLTPLISSLDETHQFVKRIEAEDLDCVFHDMQGEIWSPKGEARDLIKSLGLNHTSMNIGDVIFDEVNQKYYMVDFVGFSQIS